MPHKHKRKQNDKTDFDLPPEKKARPLSVHKPMPEKWEGFDTTTDKPNKRRKPNKEAASKSKSKDDTPKRFARLMAWQTEGKQLRKGLDDGHKAEKTKDKGKKKRQERDIVDAMAETAKRTKSDQNQKAEDQGKPGLQMERDNDQSGTVTTTTPPGVSAGQKKLKIQPGERLSDFALRVDQTLPLTNVPKHGTKDKVLGLKQKLTKHNRNLQRMQTEWRNAENKIKARQEDGEDELADKDEEDQLLWMDVKSVDANRKGKKKRRAGDLDDGDPWKTLEKKRCEGGESKVGGLRASDTVQAPPVLKPIKNLFKEPADRRVTQGIKV